MKKPERTVHELKTWPTFYEKVVTGKKTFEIREFNRPFKIGDDLLLREFHPHTKPHGEYTGRRCRVRITDIIYSNKTPFLPSFLQNGNPYVVLSIELSRPLTYEGRLIQATGVVVGLFSILVLLIWLTSPNPELKQWLMYPYLGVSIAAAAIGLGIWIWGRRLQKKICKKFWAIKEY